MKRFARTVVIATTLALPLAGCESINAFDPSDWVPNDPFGTKKKLTGERKQFARGVPEGAPGRGQGFEPRPRNVEVGGVDQERACP